MQTDRSRIISFQQCPRQRYLAYHAHGTGLQRTRKSLPLQFGSAFHEGCEALLTDQGVEEAVLRAFLFLEQAFNGHTSFDGETPADVEAAARYGRQEQMALAEALLRAWWAYEGQAFLDAFEVLQVEQEGRANLAEDLTLMFRPDALVRERQSGDHFLISWKTCATFGPRNVNQARTDMQSMSEVFGVESNGSPRIEGVIYKYAVKGYRKRDSWDGIYKQQTPLVYGWLKRGDTPEMDEWSWAYAWEKEDGSGESRLGKGYRRVPIWRDYEGGVKAWIEALAQGQIFPRHVDALAAVFPQQTPVERRADEVESWKNQVIGQETKIALTLSERGMTNPTREQLDVWFPQHTHSCHSFSGCPFIPICWGGAPAEVGELYQIRTQNHPEKGDGDE